MRSRWGSPIVEATSVVRHGLWLVWQHWPMLLTIYLFGQAARNAALWAAVVLSDQSSFAGSLLVPLAPLATVSALILMLRVVAPSLRYAVFGVSAPAAGEDSAQSSEPPATTDAAEKPGAAGSLVRDRLTLLASVVLPFFAVYAGQGLLKDDQFKFVNEAVADEFRNNVGFYLGNGALDTSRTIIADGWWFWLTVAVALGIRWLVSRLDLPRRHTGWAWFAAYIEVAWVTLLATGAMNKFTEWKTWLQQRRAAVDAQHAYEQVTGGLGPVGSAVDTVLNWVIGAIGKADAIIIVPLAWLTVGAVVYGRSLATQAAFDADDTRVSVWSQRVAKVPAPVRRVGREFFGGPVDRFRGLLSAVRTFAAAGLAPMLLFCLVFVLARQAEVLAALGLRQLLGAQQPSLMEVIQPHLDLVTRGVYTVLMVGLLAAAIDRMLAPAAMPEPVAEPAAPAVTG